VEPLPQPRHSLDPVPEQKPSVSDGEPRRGVEHQHRTDLPSRAGGDGELHHVCRAGAIHRPLKLGYRGSGGVGGVTGACSVPLQGTGGRG